MTVTGNATELLSYKENLGAIAIKKKKISLLAATPTGQKTSPTKGSRAMIAFKINTPQLLHSKQIAIRRTLPLH